MNIHLPKPRISSESGSQAPALVSVLAEVREWRSTRAADRQLRRELASYDTPAAISDLMAAVERAEGPDAEHVRSILSHNLLEVSRRSA